MQEPPEIAWPVHDRRAGEQDRAAKPVGQSGGDRSAVRERGRDRFLETVSLVEDDRSRIELGELLLAVRKQIVVDDDDVSDR